MGERKGIGAGWEKEFLLAETAANERYKSTGYKQKPNNVCPAQMMHNSDKMTIAPMFSQPCSKSDTGGGLAHSLGLKFFGLSTPFINNHKHNDTSPIKIGIATYVNIGFANPLESSIVKLFIR